MRTVVYQGPIDEVEVWDEQSEESFLATRGAPVDVPDELAEKLLEQELWIDPVEEKAAAAKKAGKGKEGKS